MKFHIMTLFPQIIEAYMSESIMKKAEEKGNIEYKTWNIRDYSESKHKKVGLSIWWRSGNGHDSSAYSKLL